MLPSSLTLRDSTPNDEPLLVRLFAENKAHQFAALPLPAGQLQSLLAMQYRARCAGYASAYPRARQSIIEESSTPIGHLLLAEDEDSIHIVDIAITPTHQARGIGSAVLRSVQERAAREARTLRLQVDPHSGAQRLYERLGFAITSRTPVLDEMVWSSAHDGKAAYA